jgi:integrin beta 8
VNRTSLKRSAAAVAVAVSILGASVGVAAAQQGTPPDQAGWTTPAGQNQIGQVPGQPGQPGQRPGPGDQNGERQRPTDEQIQQMQQQREAMQQQFIDALAKNLNLDPATVKTALDQTQKDMQAARIAEIQQAVQDGKLTQDQANQIIQRIQNGPQGGGPGFGGPGMGGPGFGGPGGGR